MIVDAPLSNICLICLHPHSMKRTKHIFWYVRGSITFHGKGSSGINAEYGDAETYQLKSCLEKLKSHVLELEKITRDRDAEKEELKSRLDKSNRRVLELKKTTCDNRDMEKEELKSCLEKSRSRVLELEKVPRDPEEEALKSHLEASRSRVLELEKGIDPSDEVRQFNRQSNKMGPPVSELEHTSTCVRGSDPELWKDGPNIFTGSRSELANIQNIFGKEKLEEAAGAGKKGEMKNLTPNGTEALRERRPVEISNLIREIIFGIYPCKQFDEEKLELLASLMYSQPPSPLPPSTTTSLSSQTPFNVVDTRTVTLTEYIFDKYTWDHFFGDDAGNLKQLVNLLQVSSCQVVSLKHTMFWMKQILFIYEHTHRNYLGNNPHQDLLLIHGLNLSFKRISEPKKNGPENFLYLLYCLLWKLYWNLCARVLQKLDFFIVPLMSYGPGWEKQLNHGILKYFNKFLNRLMEMDFSIFLIVQFFDLFYSQVDVVMFNLLVETPERVIMDFT
eukprot:TRINITY_DN8815_c0_g1_i3.p1 TRINITY_DN8815_c0_g1~~TRINITY_DN8815_c0_g1_i3.p1  ORF type:complete len:503 (+),score=120.72 TRINITY_DN8815_c0_g1_i3:947-2455(+)